MFRLMFIDPHFSYGKLVQIIRERVEGHKISLL